MASLLLCAIAACAATKTVKCKSTSTGVLAFTADSIMFRNDVTRLYGKLKGMPHTSSRIDSLTMTLSGGNKTASTDIDGVDMRRWFQWEDDGLIPVEIDFPPMKRQPSATIEVAGPHGESQWKIIIGK